MRLRSRLAQILRRSLFAAFFALLFSGVLPSLAVLAAEPSDDLAHGFLSPPASARPHMVALDERQRYQGGHHRRSRIDARVGIGGLDFQPAGRDSRRAGPLHEPPVARHVPSRRYGGRAARHRTVFPQLRWLVEQRRSLD